jgi:hypothetical protein
MIQTPIWMVFISNRPDKFVKSVRLFGGQKEDKIIVFVSETQKKEFQAAIESAALPFLVQVWTHCVKPRPDKKPPLGAIRYHAFNRVQQAMGMRDFAWMADDDAKNIRWTKPGQLMGNGRDHSYTIATPKVFRREMVRVAVAARENSFWYFTHIMNLQPHNGYNPDRELRACSSWNAFFGFFKTSPNTFNVTIGDGEDYDAAYQAVRQSGTLPILRHYGLGIDFEFVRNKYVDGGRITVLQKAYPELDIVSDIHGKKKGMPFPHFSRKKLNELKATVVPEFQ